MQKKRPIQIPAYFDYLDPELLKRYMSPFGQIKPRNRTGLSQKQQSALAQAIKRARHLALIPFVTEYVDLGRSFRPRNSYQRDDRPARDNSERTESSTKPAESKEA